MDTNVANIKIAEKIDWRKTASDLTYLKKLKEFAKNNNWRMVISGGYGLDLFLSLTTRTHSDVDVIIYGQENHDEAIKKLNGFVLDSIKNAETDAKYNSSFMELDVNAPGFGANYYFVETADNPFTNQNKVKKPNGEIVESSEEQSPKPRLGKMGDFEIEIQDQNVHLADILFKLNVDNSSSKYDQDIENLRHITDPKKVESLLQNRQVST